MADMHERKAEMARHSDCFIALPGLSLLLLNSLSLKLRKYRNNVADDFTPITTFVWFFIHQVVMGLWKSYWKLSLGLNLGFMISQFSNIN